MLYLLIVVLILLALTGPWYPYSRTWGYAPTSALGFVLLLLVVAYLFGFRF